MEISCELDGVNEWDEFSVNGMMGPTQRSVSITQIELPLH